ncbi:MAG: hypothetical protein PVH01_17420, partial [Desulfobacterales bacterium]
ATAVPGANPDLTIVLLPPLSSIDNCSDVYCVFTLQPVLFIPFQPVLKFIPLAILKFRNKDGGISVVTKKRPAIGTFL